MKDTTLYKHLLGLESPWEVTRLELDIEGGKVDVWAEHPARERFACPECGEACGVYDHVEKSWRHLDSCQYKTYLHARVPRIKCDKHGVLHARVPWAEPGTQFTALFERLAIDMLLECSVKGAAAIMGISWDEAYGIRSRAVRRGKERRDDEPIPHVGVDEKSARKGHKYITTLIDLDRGRVLETSPDRKKESLGALWEKLSEEQIKSVEAVAMDMWEPYIASTLAHIEEAGTKIVFDRFHLMKYVTGAVDKVRRLEHRERKSIGDDTLKGTRYLWLRNQENVPQSREAEFEELKERQLKVSRAWAIKECFRDFWNYTYRANAKKFFRSWFWWATHSRLEPIKKVAHMLNDRLENILTFFKHRITNSVTERINSKIENIKRSACGFRNMRNFQDAILFHCGGLDLYPTHSIS